MQRETDYPSSKKQYARNDNFYVKKRNLFRQAEQVKKMCQCEVFIFVHNKEHDKVF